MRTKKVLLSLLLFVTTLVPISAMNKADDYGNKDVDVVVTKKQVSEERMTLELQFKPKSEKVELKEIILPTSNRDTLSQTKTVVYDVYENGDYEFNVEYEVRNESKLEAISENEASPVEDEGDVEEEPEIQSPLEEITEEVANESVIQDEKKEIKLENLKFSVSVKELKENEKQLESIAQKEEAKDNQEINSLNDEEGSSEETLVDQTPLAGPQRSGAMVGNDYVLTDGFLTIKIMGYNPTTGMVVRTQDYDVEISADFEGNQTDKKTLEITLAEGLAFKNFEVIGTPIKGNGELAMDESYSNLFDLSTSPLNNPVTRKNQGTLKYAIKEGTTKVLLSKTKIVVDDSLYTSPKTISDALSASIKIGDSVINEIIESIPVYGPWNSNFRQSSVKEMLVVEGESDALHFGENIMHLDSSPIFTKQAIYTYHYPLGAKLSRVEFLPNSVGDQMVVKSIEDDPLNGVVRIITENEFRLSMRASLQIYLDISELPVGDNLVTGKNNSIELLTYDGSRIVVESQFDRNIKVIRLSDLTNKLIHQDLNSNSKFSPTTEDNEMGLYAGLKIHNDGVNVKTNQHIKYSATSGFEAYTLQIGLPYDIAITKPIKYRTNLDSIQKTVPISSIIPNNLSITSSSLVESSTLLADNEYFTEFIIEYGDVEKNIVLSDRGVNLASTSGLIGKLSNGVLAADLIIETYSEDKYGFIDADSVVTTVKKLERGNDRLSTIQYNTSLTNIFAGERNRQTLSFNVPAYFYPNNMTTTHNENFIIYHILPTGFDIDLETFKLSMNRSGSFVDSSNFDVSKYTLNSTGQKIVKIEINETLSLMYQKDGVTTTGHNGRLTFDYIVNANQKGQINTKGLIFTASKDKNILVSTGGARDTTDLDLDNDGTVGRYVGTGNDKFVSIIRKNQLTIDSYIKPEGGEKQPAFTPGKDQTAVGFTPGTIAEYTIEMENNLDGRNVEEVQAFIPVPKEGYDFGTHFQSSAFAWNMKLAGQPTLQIFDKDGNDITAAKQSEYEITYSSDASNETNYVGATYNSSYNDQATMIRVFNNSNNMVPGEKFVLSLKYQVDEVAGAPGIEAKLGKVNDFMPYYYYDAGNAGWDSGTRVGTRLEIGQISGTVFLDKDYNGVFDNSDEPVANKTVTLYKWGGSTPLYTTTTDATGNYHFEGLPTGNFFVNFNDVTSTGFEFTKMRQGSDASIYSHAQHNGANRGKTGALDSTKKTSESISAGIVAYDKTQLSVDITKNSTSILMERGELLAHTISPDTFDYVKSKNVWTSADPTIAAVSNAGYVTAMGVGTTTITVQIEDMYGNTASDTITVTIMPNTKPELELSVSSVDIEVKTTGFVAKDYILKAEDSEDVGLGIDDVVITMPSSADFDTVGTFVIKYELTDSDGNKVEKNLVVNVVDTTVPVITADDVTLEVQKDVANQKTIAEILGLANITVTDNYDENMGYTHTGTDLINQGLLGTYTVTLNAKDSSNNSAVAVSFDVIIEDTTAPVITADDVTLEVQKDVANQKTIAEILGLANITVTDNYDVSVNYSHSGTDLINQGLLGTYPVTLNAKDSSNNAAVTVSFNVIVKDTIAPVITATDVTLEVQKDVANQKTIAEILGLANITVTDNYDNGLAYTHSGTNLINQGILGTYTVTVNTKDSSNNDAVAVSFDVIIKDSTAPVITASDVTLEVQKDVANQKTIAEILGLANITVTDNYDENMVYTHSGTDLIKQDVVIL